MRNRKSIDCVALLIAAAAVITIVGTVRESAPRVDRKLHAEIGRTLAKEALGLLGSGGQITVLSRDLEAFRQPALEILIKNFQQEIRASGKAKLVIQSVQSDPLRPVEVPPGDFYEAIRKSGADNVIVSLLGPPVLTEEHFAKLGRIRPKVIALCSGNLAEVIDLDRLFESGFLRVAIVNRKTSETSSNKNARSSTTLDQLYTIVRAGKNSVSPPAPTNAKL